MKGKIKDPSIQKGESTAAGKGVAEIDSPGKGSHDSSEDMNADELAAFKKIMGEIEGQEEEKLNGTAKASGNEKKDDQELTEDELAQLNGVIETINSENGTDEDLPGSAMDGAAPAEDVGDESLDEDQQRAFESIMAQIESGSTGNPDSGKEEGAASGSETTDGFSAELEKVVQESETVGHDPTQGSEGTESDDALNDDQQQAFDSIMAQIEGGNTESSAPEPAGSESADPKMEGTSEDQEQKTVRRANDDADEDSHDISHDIDDILTEIASTDEASPLPAAAAGHPVPEPATLEPSEKTIVNDDSGVSKKESIGLAHTDRPRTSPSEERSSAKEPSIEPLSAKKAVPVSSKNLQKTQPLREAPLSTGGWPRKTILATAAAVLFLALTGYFYRIPPRIVDSGSTLTDTDTSRQDAVVEPQPAKPDQGPVAVVQGSSGQSRLERAAENLDRLRSELIEKRSEIEELRTYYQAGIDAEIQGIAERVRKTGKGPLPFDSALADPLISLGLSAIQRRDTYIKKLETPANALFWHSEELLFFSRKAGLFALMAGKTSDIDIDGFIKQADEIIQVHGSALARLNIDTVPATPMALESIWQDIDKHLPRTTVKPEPDNLVTDTDNPAIWKNICEGDFSRKNRLTVLSPEAARCLAMWKGKDLFLNALTALSPEAARYLATWDGDWLGLNGLDDLSPEAAVHLSRWKGKGLSLNGLSRLSPRVVAILSEWQGEQIELVNVKHMAYWENPKTRLFLSEDMKRKYSALRK